MQICALWFIKIWRVSVTLIYSKSYSALFAGRLKDAFGYRGKVLGNSSSSAVASSQCPKECREVSSVNYYEYGRALGAIPVEDWEWWRESSIRSGKTEYMR